MAGVASPVSERLIVEIAEDRMAATVRLKAADGEEPPSIEQMVAAIKAAGKTETVLVVGFDNIGAVQKLVKAGSVLCTVDQHGDELAVYGIEYALEILTNKTTPADKETPVDLITADNLK